MCGQVGPVLIRSHGELADLHTAATMLPTVRVKIRKYIERAELKPVIPIISPKIANITSLSGCTLSVWNDNELHPSFFLSGTGGINAAPALGRTAATSEFTGNEC
jgi:hypothetical protein